MFVSKLATYNPSRLSPKRFSGDKNLNIRITLLSAGIRKMKMKAKWLPIAAAVTAALASQAAFAVDFHGYFRSGVGVSGDGDMVKYNVKRLVVWVTKMILTAKFSWVRKSSTKMARLST
jgi:hypothetical protein